METLTNVLYHQKQQDDKTEKHNKRRKSLGRIIKLCSLVLRNFGVSKEQGEVTIWHANQIFCVAQAGEKVDYVSQADGPSLLAELFLTSGMF